MGCRRCVVPQMCFVFHFWSGHVDVWLLYCLMIVGIYSTANRLRAFDRGYR